MKQIKPPCLATLNKELNKFNISYHDSHINTREYEKCDQWCLDSAEELLLLANKLYNYILRDMLDEIKKTD